MCPCCQKEGITENLVIHLQMVHNLLPQYAVMIITSGFRCPEHNKTVGGIEDSAHMKGLAADIKCNNSTYRFHLINALIRVGFKRIGRYDNFIHADLDEDKPQPRMW